MENPPRPGDEDYLPIPLDDIPTQLAPPETDDDRPTQYAPLDDDYYLAPTQLPPLTGNDFRQSTSPLKSLKLEDFNPPPMHKLTRLESFWLESFSLEDFNHDDDIVRPITRIITKIDKEKLDAAKEKEQLDEAERRQTKRRQTESRRRRRKDWWYNDEGEAMTEPDEEEKKRRRQNWVGNAEWPWPQQKFEASEFSEVSLETVPTWMLTTDEKQESLEKIEKSKSLEKSKALEKSRKLQRQRRGQKKEPELEYEAPGSDREIYGMYEHMAEYALYRAIRQLGQRPGQKMTRTTIENIKNRARDNYLRYAQSDPREIIERFRRPVPKGKPLRGIFEILYDL